MKKFWNQNGDSIIFVFELLLFWRFFLFIPQLLGQNLIEEHPGYIGPIPWANLDGIHYLSIAQNGYLTYEQAFFPLFPLLIRLVSNFLNYNYILSSIFIVHISLFITLVLFYKLVKLDYSDAIAKWSIVFLLFFPTSFFLGSIYSESLFLMLILGSFYAARKKNWILSGILGALASATRFVGIFMLPILINEWLLQKDIHTHKKGLNQERDMIIGLLLIPVGLFSYMLYLLKTYGDSLLFIHSQPAFGAGRSGGGIILLPQIFYRYFEIFIHVPFSNYDYWIALLEIVVFLLVLFFLYRSYTSGMRKSYVYFSAFSILVPTLSGTLSSTPRYSLASFALFIFFATISKPSLRYLILAIGIILEGILSTLFFRGYFVS